MKRRQAWWIYFAWFLGMGATPAFGAGEVPPALGTSQIIERPNNPALVPQDYGLTTPSDDVQVSPSDRYVALNDQERIVLVDTADFNLASAQPDPLDSRTESYEFLPNSTSLFIHQTDAFITRILADDPLNDVLNVDISDSISTGVGNLVLDSEAIDNRLFILTFSDNVISDYSISSQSVTNSSVVTDPDVPGPLNNMTYIALPTTNGQGGTVDKIAITTNNGRIIFFDEDLNFLATVPLIKTNDDCPSDSGDPNSNRLPAAAVNTIRDLLFVLNSTDNVVHVLDTITQEELDDSPICLHQIGPNGIDRDINNNIRDIVIMRVNDPVNAARGFVTGDLGVTLLNASENNLGVIDAFDTEGEDPNFIESIPVSANPDHIASSSQSDGYFYTTNMDNSVSILSDNPFVTIASANPDTVTQADPVFTLTFQVDELCDGCPYRLRANGDIDESGTLLLETTYTAEDAVNTELITPPVDINNFPSGTFIEGQNRIFIFSDDSSGKVGRDSIFVTVDTPPPDVTILDVQFGNASGFVTIERLTQEDIKQYNFFVLEALDQNNPTCPGGLDFSAVAPTTSVGQPGSGSDVRVKITGLTNDVAYCIGVQAEDNGGNLSPNIVVATEVLIPEVTVGIAGASGETGCQLSSHVNTEGRWVWGWLLGLLLLGTLFRLSKSVRHQLLLGLVLCSLFYSTPAQAIEVTDQKWAAQFQGGFFLPTNEVLDRFLGKCCNGMYQFTFGRLWKSRYEVNVAVGLMSEGASAEGINTGRVSGERFNFTVVPISNSFVYRADYVENQLLVPYVSVGFDYMYFRENLQGNITKGFKFGYHAAGGLQILLEFFDTMADSMEEYGINDVYLTLEGKWQQIDNFGGGGLAFNGFTFSAGLLFEF